MSYTEYVDINDALNFAQCKKIDRRWSAGLWADMRFKLSTGLTYHSRGRLLDLLTEAMGSPRMALFHSDDWWYKTEQYKHIHGNKPDWAVRVTGEFNFELYFKSEEAFEQALFMMKLSN